MNIRKMQANRREIKNFASIFKRLAIAKRLERNGTLILKGDELTLLPGNLVSVKGNAPTHPINGDPLDNPMTWDSFVNIYLLDKGD